MTPGTIDVAGRRLETAWWGRPDARAPTLVLLHEGLGCVALWRDFPHRLAEATGRRVFAWSRAGYGRSETAKLPRPVGYMHDEAALLGTVLDAAEIGACLLVGHSDGASIAAIHAGSAADPRVRGLVLIAPHFFVEDMCIAAIAAARRAYDAGDLRARLARHHDDVDCAFRGWNEAWLDPAFRAFDLTVEVARIGVPTLVVQGTDDPYGTQAQPVFAARMAPRCVTTSTIAGARHAPHLETADAAMAAIAPFVARAISGVTAL